MKNTPTVLNFAEHNAEGAIANRDLMLGVDISGESRAFPYDTVLREKLIKDRVAGRPVLSFLPDDKSVRVFLEFHSGREHRTRLLSHPAGHHDRQRDRRRMELSGMRRFRRRARRLPQANRRNRRLLVRLEELPSGHHRLYLKPKVIRSRF